MGAVEYWINKNKASLTPPAPAPVDISGLVSAVQTLSTKLDAQTQEVTEISDMVQRLVGQIATFTTIAIVEGVAIVVLVVLAFAVIKMRRPPPAEEEEEKSYPLLFFLNK